MNEASNDNYLLVTHNYEPTLSPYPPVVLNWKKQEPHQLRRNVLRSRGGQVSRSKYHGLVKGNMLGKLWV